ncbi:MAG: ATP-binding protein [Acidimicrobiales bacterium]|jgi:AAA+ superfamily predicted ATPase|nr:ATP-binding protein [Acidimicrobiales bacterium]
MEHPTGDEQVYAGIEAALQVEPANRALRLHLIALLLTGGQPGRALRHCELAWSTRPDQPEVAALAAQACDLLGDPAGAAHWRALGPSPADGLGDAVPGPPPEPVPDAVGMADVAGTAGGEGPAWLDVDRPTVRLVDVAGMVEVKQRLERALLAPLRNAELRAAFGKTLRGGLLLWGPPGCGKTFIARALAGEMGVSFVPVALSDVLDMWLGNSEQNVHRVFQRARRDAPAVLFLDELDAIGHRRTNLRGDGMRNVVTQLLAELDGVDSANDELFCLGATNQPWMVDAALRRPGRFDRTVLVLPPDPPARWGILRQALADRPVAAIDLDPLVARTETWSGADLVHLVDSAAELALAESVDAGAVRPITQRHLDGALRELGPSIHDWLDTARSVAAASDDSRTFAPLVDYLRRVRKW